MQGRRTHTRSLSPARFGELVDVSKSMVMGWLESGMLKSRRLPGSKYRRIDLPDALEFAQSESLPLEDLERHARREGLSALAGQLLLASPNECLAKPLVGAGFGVRFARSAGSALTMLTLQQFDAVLLDCELGSKAFEVLKTWVQDERPGTWLGAIALEDATATEEDWQSWGFRAVYRRPFDPVKMANDLRKRVA